MREYNEELGGANLLSITRRASHANRFLISYIHYLCERRKPISWARHVVLAIQHNRRHLKGKSRAAWDSVESWQMEIELRILLPLPEVVRDAVFYLASALGFSAADCDQRVLAGGLISLAILVDLGFDALLRTGEMYGVTAGRVRVPPCGRRRRRRHIFEKFWLYGSVHIPRPKTFPTFRRPQFATFG